MNRDTLILNQKSAHTLGFFDAEKGEAITQITLPNYPHEFVVDSNREFAYVGHYGVENSGIIGDNGGCDIFVIDIKRKEHVRTISAWPYFRIHGLAMDNQDRLYAMSESHNVMVIYENPQTATAPDRALPSGGLKTHLFSLSADGETAFCLNLLSHTVTKIRPWEPTVDPVAMYPGKKPEGNCLAQDGKTLFVTNRLDNSIVAVDTTSLTVKASAASGQDPTRVYLSPNQQLFVTNYQGGSISIYDQTLMPQGVIELPADPIAVSFHPDGTTAYVSMTNDQVAVLDVSSTHILRTFNCLAEPDVSFLLPAHSQN
ncbi:hypothetical protein BCT30_07595 [Enterovibrio norvegicus]|uniref:YncE family protein n=1 Tax=Enterovibrio norvegicus TaxID=188144 RepID=UPI000C863C5E|nr:YncE family protein [Enterovibrio norvegicus]PMI40804.1 hypothetical protein BCU46_05235 [Enterovibrio norvegicus]PMN56308.1 hypothetical protein BCT30_07595 [Enterovibrio norvegicus]